MHLNNCPHNISYFLMWHRGYLYDFEQQLRAVSGNPNLVLPYWDYYTTPDIPSEFTNPASYNPLYLPRLNTNVVSALTLAPFAATLTNMPRGQANSFEVSIENMPHNPVHNIIGNAMSDMQSPTDPIFWLHHANIDRLLSAWAQGGDGRAMPSSTDTYWSGDFTYATKLTMARSSTIRTRDNLGYFYQNETMPTSLPVASLETDGGFQLASMRGELQLAQAELLRPGVSGAGRLLNKPAVQSFAASSPRSRGENRRAIGGVRSIPLNEVSISADLGIDTASSHLLQGVVNQADASPRSHGRQLAAGMHYRSAQLVLDSISLVGDGEQGGFFYQIYLNLPSSTDLETANARYLAGGIGAFEIRSALHRAHMNLDPGGTEPGTARRVFPVTLLLKDLLGPAGGKAGGVTVSMVRFNGGTAPSGDVIRIGEVRLELSLDAVA